MTPSPIARVLLVGLLTLSCTVTETGNPSFTAQMSLSAISSDPQVADFELGHGGVMVSSAWVSLGDLRFIRAEDCDEAASTRTHVEGPIVFDSVASPRMLSFPLDSGSYCRLRVPLERATPPLPGGAPPELEGHTLLLHGERSDGVNFELVSRRTEAADVRSRSEPFAYDAARRAVVLALDVARWFEGVDLSSATLETDGSIVISNDANSELLDAFEGNLKRSLRLFRDLDEDGLVDADAELLAEGTE